MASWKNSIVVHAPADTVFAYVDEPMTLAEWLPGMVEIRNVIGTGAGQQQEWTVKMAGLLLRGQATVVEHVPNKSAVHQTIGMISSNFGYAVEPHEEGSVLTLEVEYSVPIPVLGKLAEHIVLRRNEREFQIGLQNVKDTLGARPTRRRQHTRPQIKLAGFTTSRPLGPRLSRSRRFNVGSTPR